MYWEAKRFKKHSISGIKMCCGAKCSEEQSMNLQKCAKKQSVLGSKVCLSLLTNLYHMWDYNFRKSATLVFQPITKKLKLLFSDWF